MHDLDVKCTLIPGGAEGVLVEYWRWLREEEYQ